MDAAALCMILREPGGEECKRHQGCPVMWWFKSAPPPSIHPPSWLSLFYLLLSALENLSFPCGLPTHGRRKGLPVPPLAPAHLMASHYCCFPSPSSCSCQLPRHHRLIRSCSPHILEQDAVITTHLGLGFEDVSTPVPVTRAETRKVQAFINSWIICIIIPSVKFSVFFCLSNQDYGYSILR